MLYYLLIFMLLAIAFFILLIVITCISCLGLAKPAKEFILKLGRKSHDRQFVEAQARQPLNTDCYICLERVKNQVVATCSHSYCARCIIDYINSQGDRPINCPACRKEIYVLMRRFNPTNYDEMFLKDKISEYNYKHSKQPSLFRSITEISILLKQIPILLSQDGLRFLLSNSRVKFILMMIVYTLSPFDLLPQAFLGPIGLIDDSAVAINIARQFGGLIVDFFREQPMRDRERMNSYRNNNNANRRQNLNPYGGLDSSNQSNRNNQNRNPYPDL